MKKIMLSMLFLLGACSLFGSFSEQGIIVNVEHVYNDRLEQEDNLVILNISNYSLEKLNVDLSSMIDSDVDDSTIMHDTLVSKAFRSTKVIAKNILIGLVWSVCVLYGVQATYYCALQVPGPSSREGLGIVFEAAGGMILAMGHYGLVGKTAYNLWTSKRNHLLKKYNVDFVMRDASVVDLGKSIRVLVPVKSEVDVDAISFFVVSEDQASGHLKLVATA